MMIAVACCIPCLLAGHNVLAITINNISVCRTEVHLQEMDAVPALSLVRHIVNKHTDDSNRDTRAEHSNAFDHDQCYAIEMLSCKILENKEPRDLHPASNTTM
jgi:hypothetical protein